VCSSDLRVLLPSVQWEVRDPQVSVVFMCSWVGSCTFVFLFVPMRIRARCVGGSARFAVGYVVGRVGTLCVSVTRDPRGPLVFYLSLLLCFA